jgi:hypothetical protein
MTILTREDCRHWQRTPRGKIICPDCGESGYPYFGERSWINKHAEHMTCECGKVKPVSTIKRHRAHHPPLPETGIGALVQQLLGCAWGRSLWSPDDTEPCQKQAVKIIVLHHNGEEADARLCDHHSAVVMLLTDPHQFPDQEVQNEQDSHPG